MYYYAIRQNGISDEVKLIASDKDPASLQEKILHHIDALNACKVDVPLTLYVTDEQQKAYIPLIGDVATEQFSLFPDETPVVSRRQQEEIERREWERENCKCLGHEILLGYRRSYKHYRLVKRFWHEKTEEERKHLTDLLDFVDMTVDGISDDPEEKRMYHDVLVLAYQKDRSFIAISRELHQAESSVNKRINEIKYHLGQTAQKVLTRETLEAMIRQNKVDAMV